MNNLFKLSISFQRVFGALLIILGLFFAIQSSYLTNGPFVMADGVVTEKSLLLKGGKNKTLVKYNFKVFGDEYQGESFLPVSYYPDISLGDGVPIYYLYWNPEFSSLKTYPKPTPIVQVNLCVVLLGVVLLYFPNKKICG